MRRGLYVLLGVLLVPSVGLVGDVVTDGKFTSTLSSGAPIEVASTGMVSNLNADMVDGVEGTDIYTKAQVDAMLAAVLEIAEPREYYLTAAEYYGNQPLGVCAAGFHMANLFEIADPSNLRYAYDHPDAQNRHDNGQGPPTGVLGWIRTGESSRTDPIPGYSNCNTWQTNEVSSAGTTAGFPNHWANPAQGILALVWGTPWTAIEQSCSQQIRVWCVED
jgi:hypothetical protein